MRRLAAFLALPAAALLAGCAGPRVADGGRCLAWLDAHAVAYTRLDPSAPQGGRCAIDTPVRLARAGLGLARPAVMSCYLAARLDAFVRGSVMRLALDDLGHRVSRIEHLGAYSCRASTGRHDRLSEHAFGLAIDIAGFRLADGSRVNVETDWWAPGPKRDFLHHLARAACGYFSVVLTPDSNRDHFNHLHFDLGPERLCSI